MDEARLDDLIRKLHQLPLEEPETKDCPPFAKLWAYESSGQPLGNAEEHVRQCPGCQRLMGIMREELAVADAGTRPTRPFRFLHRAGVVLAAAASIAILVLIGWPTGPSDAEVAAMITPICDSLLQTDWSAPVLRGPGHDETSAAVSLRSRLGELVEGLEDALAKHQDLRNTLHREWEAGRITSNERGYLVLTAKGQAAAASRRERFERWIDQENLARDKIVEAIQAYEPALKDVQADKIRRTLDRYLVKQVFGGD